MNVIDTELGSVYALTKMRMSERENFDELDEYFEKYYDLDFETFVEFFTAMTENVDALTIEDAFTIAMNCYEFGHIHKEYKRDIDYLGDTHERE